MARKKFEDGQEIKGVFYLSSLEVKVAKNGVRFLKGAVKFDSDTDLIFRIFEDKNSVESSFERLKNILVPKGFYKISGYISKKNDLEQLEIEDVEKVEGVVIEDYLPKSVKTREELIKEFEGIVESLKDEDYKKLLKFFERSEYFEKYTLAPAAQKIHHAYLYGLIEHSINLTKIVDALIPIYPSLDRDLLITGAILHDVGKCLEISSKLNFEYTVEGKLLGHIFIGANIVEEIIGLIGDFPQEKRLKLIHLILSHQGFRADGFGSPVDPSTPESLFFHFIDNLDAKMKHIFYALENDVSEELFIQTQPLKLWLYKGEKEKVGELPEKEPDEKKEKKSLYDET